MGTGVARGEFETRPSIIGTRGSGAVNKAAAGYARATEKGNDRRRLRKNALTVLLGNSENSKRNVLSDLARAKGKRAGRERLEMP